MIRTYLRMLRELLFFEVAMFVFLFLQELAGDRPQSQGQLTVKYEKKTPNHPKMQSVEESNALKNWQMHMRERRRQQDHLSSMYMCILVQNTT